MSVALLGIVISGKNHDNGVVEVHNTDVERRRVIINIAGR